MTAITRRQGIAMLAGLAAGTAAGVAEAAPESGLHAIARAKGMRFGSAVAWGARGADRGAFANPDYAALLVRDCGVVVAENEMKWQAIRPAADRFDFARSDAMLAQAEARGMAMRGHNLLWHQPKWMPRWLATHDFGARPAQAAERMLVEHVTAVCRRYGDRIRSYDVVNEAVRPEDGGLYDTALSTALGGTEPTLDLAFRTARAAAPGAELVYNDYMGWEADSAVHRAGVLRLLEGFRRRGVPVDALGLQSHLITQAPGAAAAPLQRDWQRFLDAVTAMGYRLVVTELDVRDDGLPADPGVCDRAVADWTRAYLDVTLSFRQVRDVIAWGMTDRYSWVEGFKSRPDGARRRPCPYDDRFRPKPMRAAIAAALAAAPVRS